MKTGQNPDAIIYEPVTHRVFTFNGRSSDATAIDAKTGDVITASIPVGGKPEFAQVDGKGHVYVNIEDKNEIIEIDAKNALVSKRYSIAPCDGPSGLAIDPKKALLYSVCGNKMMIVSDPATGKVLATPAIGAESMASLSTTATPSAPTAADSNITMVDETPRQIRARRHHRDTARRRTIASDQKAHKLYLPAAEFGPPPPPTARMEEAAGRRRCRTAS